jgi:coproporphyrinogen III oxidase-like Fe-S oxidoreductase
MMNSLASVEKVNKEQYMGIFSRRVFEEAVRLGWIIEEDGSLRLTQFGRLLWKKMRG